MSDEEIKPIEINEAVEQIDTQSVRSSQPQENQNDLTEAIREIAQRCEALVEASEKADPSDAKFCKVLHLVCEIHQEISDKKHVNQLLKEVLESREVLVQEKQFCEESLKAQKKR